VISRVSVALLALALMCVGVADVCHAQSVTRRTFKTLQRVQEMMNEEQYPDALAALQELAARTGDNPYDFALANQYLAQVHVALDDVAAARRALESALAQPGLPEDLQANLNLFYGTILLAAEEFDGARKALEKWFAIVEDPRPSQIFSLAYAYESSGSPDKAEPLLARAIAETSDPPDSWYQLQYRTLFELKRYDQAESVLRGRIERAPRDGERWRLLASHHLRLDRNHEALATLAVAHSQGLITTETQLRQMLSLYGYVDLPERAARLLAELMDAKKLPEDPEQLLQLGRLWMLARDRDNAAAAYTKAAARAKDGVAFELLGGVRFEQERWSEALDAYQKALRAGGLEDKPRVALLAGLAAVNADRPVEARRALEAAAASDEYRAQAKSLLQQLER